MIEIVAEHQYERLDVFIAEYLEITRSKAQSYIKEGFITGDKKLKPSMKVSEGDKFSVELPESPNLTELKAEPVEFEVVYEDEYLLVINKPSGLVVHPAPGNWNGTLANGLVYRYPEFRLMTNRLRPGIVHRLDAGTSGLMIAARTQSVCDELQKKFAAREVHKTYLALVHNCPKKHEGILSGPIDRDPDNFLRMAIVENGKPSLTGYRVLWNVNHYSLIECRLFTGRMHQIRVHMSALGCPLVGDNLYGADDDFDGRIFLHSWRLSFEHTVTHEILSFRQIIPNDFMTRLRDIISR